MSWISRHKLPVILTAIALVLAAVAVVVVTAFIQPRHQQENDYATATKRLAAAQKANQKAHDAFDTALKSVTELRTSMAELPDAPKGLFPAASLAKFTADVKDLDQAASTQAPTALTDLPKGDVSYSVATKALTRARTGVMENTTITKQATDSVQNTLAGVHGDLQDAASAVSDQAQSVLVANQGATDAAQTAFAASSDISGDGDSDSIVQGLKAYIAAGKQVIAENKEHPAVVEDDEPETEPSEATSPSPDPQPTVTAQPSPTPPPTKAPSKAPSPSPTTAPVDHTPHVVANGQYLKSCTAPTTLFTQETRAGGTITINDELPYTYQTYDTAVGFGVKVSRCTAT